MNSLKSIFVSVESGEAEITLTGFAKARAWSAIDVAAIKHGIEELP